MKHLSSLVLALVMMVSGSVFAADTAPTAGGASSGEVPKGTPALCPCGPASNPTAAWCPCGTEGASGTISTVAIVAGVAVAGVIAAAAGHSSSTTQH